MLTKHIMKICKHISFFYNETLRSRLVYLEQLLQITKTYDHETHIFIHTNKDSGFDMSLINVENIQVGIIYHDLSDIHPYFLTWKPRELMRQQKDVYDIFIYVEDDILIKNETIQYWLQHKDAMITRGFNLGFVRIETDQNQTEFVTDIVEPLYAKTIIEDQEYVINTGNVYCGMWILDKIEFAKYVNSKYYDLQNIHSVTEPHMSREKSAWGLNAPEITWYTHVLMPMKNGELDPDARIYHLPNNYIGSGMFASIPFKNIVS